MWSVRERGEEGVELRDRFEVNGRVELFSMVGKEACREQWDRFTTLIGDQLYDFVWEEGEVINLVKEEEKGESATTWRATRTLLAHLLSGV